ncbi:hypothetical protein ACH5RR_040009 [Cinchona calisaya]|uniref:Ubiquitin-like domain-containing protein n=1 Tax=Cinchona calisaya TaxID=153742 RepID=A0ABD2XZZ2_9GENT
MASNGDDIRLVSGKDEPNCSETSVEIKIKTLDSQTYTLRVDKCVPIPALKEQIALVTGVLSEQQRLICRGRVLKDDQLLSAYHVEDGHTLHLVVRQPVVPASEGTPNPSTDPASTSGHTQGSRGPCLVVESFNISEQDGTFSHLSRVFSALFGSLGNTGVGSGSEGIDLNEHLLERILNAPGLAGLRNSSRLQPDLADSRGQSITDSGCFSLPTADPLESLQLPVIPDSLTTLSQNINRLRQAFTANVQDQSNSSQVVGIHGRDGQNSDATSVSSVHRGLPTPALLADVILTTRQILNEQVEECLLLLARQLEGHANVTDASERARIQSSAVRSGVLFHNLGAVLLELARTIMTLRIGQTPAEAIVNAGPALFLSPTGPNPIMVQPLPFQLGTGLGASGGTVQQSSGLPAGSGGSGVFPRNIDIRIIRTVAVPASVSRRESTGLHNHERTAPGAFNIGNSAQQGSGRDSGNPASMESEVRVVPISSVVTSVPGPGRRSTSDPSRGTMGMMLPVFARVQRVTSGISGSGTGVHAAVDRESQSIPNIAVERQNDHVVEVADGQGYPMQLASQLEHLLRGMYSGDHLQGEGTEADAVTGDVGTAAQNGDNSEAEAAAAAASGEGTFLSNLLRQIIPIIYENGESGPNSSSSENGNRATSSRRQDDPAEQPGPKRHKRD